MKPSKYITKFAFINILKKKQRTLLSILAVCLSTTIIFTSASLFHNIYQFSKNTNYEAIGNYHYMTTIEDVTPVMNHRRYHVSVEGPTGYSNNEIELHAIQSYDDNMVFPFTITKDQLPHSNQEVLIPDTMHYNQGDQLTLNFTMKNKETITFHFKVAGVYHLTDSMKDLYPKYQIYTTDMGLQSNHIYVKDEQIHLRDSFSFFLNKADVTSSQVISNQAVISQDSINNYLKDTSVLLVIFIILGLIGFAISKILVHNVILISDKDRKKEIGLLKSIGATPVEIKKLIIIELLVLGIIGSILGILLGMLVTMMILKSFIDQIYVQFSLSMILNPFILILSFLLGIGLMYHAGMKAYGSHIYTSVIHDLKAYSYDYGTPEKPKKTRRNTFSWKMFMIYNSRMKKQSKNIFYSFTLLLFTTVLFTAIYLSNIVYVNTYVNLDYDLEVTNYHEQLGDGGLKAIDPEVSYRIYDLEKQHQIDATSIFATRLELFDDYYFSNIACYDEDVLAQYKAISRIAFETMEREGETYANIYSFPAVLDHYQLNELKPYLEKGQLDDLGPKDLVAIYSKEDTLGEALATNMNVGSRIYQGKDANDYRTIQAVVLLPESAYEKLHFDYKSTPRIFASSLEAQLNNQTSNPISEHIYLQLRNKDTCTSVEDVLSQHLNDNYNVSNIAAIVTTNRFTTYIIEVLLYPLFFMLFIISLLNLNNVFIGNVHLKRNDISIMKSIGMTSSQLKTLFTFEYVDGYLNGMWVVCAIFIPFSLLISYLPIASVFDFGGNLFATLLVSLCLIGVMLIAPLAYLSLKRITKILPIENLKDID